MKTKIALHIGVRCIAIGVAVCLLAACASRGTIVDHAFSFDTFSDSPEVEVLDYRYGDSKLPGASVDDTQRQGQAPQRINISGPMRLGDSLYVKWRVKTSGAVYERTVDLRNRLPRDMTGQRIHFVPMGSQLSVYLVSPQVRPNDTPPNGPRMYQRYVVTTIYPDKST